MKRFKMIFYAIKNNNNEDKNILKKGEYICSVVENVIKF